MTKQSEKKIQSLLNREVQYGIKVITITGYDFDPERGRVFLHTNEKENHFDRPVSEINVLLKQFQLVGSTSVAKIDQATTLMTTAANADILKDILMKNIEKVQVDAGYIKQATSINNNINSIINITKMQLDYAKAASKLR